MAKRAPSRKMTKRWRQAKPANLANMMRTSAIPTLRAAPRATATRKKRTLVAVASGSNALSSDCLLS